VAENRLKRVKNQPNERSIQRVSRSFGASCERSSSAASAGASVSELNAELTVEDGDGERELLVELAGEAAPRRRSG